MKNGNKNCDPRRRYENGGFHNARIAIYTNDDDGNKYFLELLKFAIQQGWKNPVSFSDPQKNKCPTAGMDELLEAVSQERVDIVLIRQLSDVALSLEAIAKFLEQLQAANVVLVSISENIDSRQLPSLALSAKILKAWSEFQKIQASRKTKDGLSAAKARGIKLGRPDKSQRYQKKVDALHKRGDSTRSIAQKLRLSLPMTHKLIVKARS